MSGIWQAHLADRLAERETAGLMRRRRVLESPQGPEVVIGDRTLLQFCSNDYLGLCAAPELAEAMQTAVEDWGTGSGASHLINGHLRPHEELEQSFAAFSGRDQALLFSTGYMANLGVIEALCDRSTEIFEDRLNHASLIDGARLSGARLRRYRHNDLEHLGLLLAASPAPRKLVVTDGVFSMDGDMAPLPELAALCAAHDALLMVDDAHGVGVMGPRGGGTLDWFGLSQDEVPILVATLGKALGVSGALVGGPDWLMRALMQYARTYIYTTAHPPALAVAARAALEYVRQGHASRMQLQMMVAHFRQGCLEMGLPLMESQTPIQPIRVGEARVAIEAARRLEESGLLVPAIRPPTVPEGEARLRVTLSAAHSMAQVDRLLHALRTRVLPLL
ncbi:MAG: 8-amino-7-oxononanoate synthase [Gammaproteobacteria bacterium]|nr:MAG: 8-amino-7-oxononanoate synthase [Gammaproteobacteria bacterium]